MLELKKNQKDGWGKNEDGNETPFINMSPDSYLFNPTINLTRVDLPLPILPIKPIFSLGLIRRLKFLNTLVNLLYIIQK